MQDLSLQAQKCYDNLLSYLIKCVSNINLREFIIDRLDELVSVLLDESKKQA